MKKILLGVFTTFVIILLTGCGKDSPSVALCKKMTPQMEKYESGEITYKEFLDTIKPDYDKYCSKDPETICTFVSGMYFSEQTDLEIRDCSMYNDEAGKSFKEACEISNETRRTIAANKEKTEKNSITLLKRDCSIAK